MAYKRKVDLIALEKMVREGLNQKQIAQTKLVCADFFGDMYLL